MSRNLKNIYFNKLLIGIGTFLFCLLPLMAPSYAQQFLPVAGAGEKIPQHLLNQDSNQSATSNETSGFWMSDRPLQSLTDLMPSDMPINWELPTLGGQHFWSDIHYWGGWRIQRNSETGHHRLLDPHLKRKTWGTQEHCQQSLSRLIERGKVQPEQGTVVILLHGLWRSNDSMAPLQTFIHQQAGFTIINLAYASARGNIETHAADLGSVIEGLSDQITEIHVVGHSMGNIVFRCYLGQCHRQGRPIDIRFKRMVMLAPPNQGSRVARSLSRSLAFQTLAGLGGMQLGVGWQALEPNLGTPSFEFGIIAGAAEDEKEASLLTPRDFTVFTNETYLDGATGFHRGPYFHWNVKYHPQAMDETLHFLKTGRFKEPSPKPIE